MNPKYVIGAVLLFGLLIFMIRARLQKVEAARAAREYVPSFQYGAAPLTPAATNQPAASSGAGSSSPGINPAHGLPGHRCDIAVGAPLPAGKAVVNNSSTGTQIFTPQSGGNVTTSSSTPKPKFNPAHGQAWHRCDLQVGAPLT